MSRGPGHVELGVLRAIGEPKKVWPPGRWTYRELAKTIYGTDRPAPWQHKYVGRACRGLADLGHVEIHKVAVLSITEVDGERYEVPEHFFDKVSEGLGHELPLMASMKKRVVRAVTRVRP